MPKRKVKPLSPSQQAAKAARDAEIAKLLDELPADRPKAATPSNPLAPTPGDEYHVVLTRSELMILIHTGAGSIQHFASHQHENIHAAVAIQNLSDRVSQLAGFLAANRPTLH